MELELKITKLELSQCNLTDSPSAIIFFIDMDLDSYQATGHTDLFVQFVWKLEVDLLKPLNAPLKNIKGAGVHRHLKRNLFS